MATQGKAAGTVPSDGVLSAGIKVVCWWLLLRDPQVVTTALLVAGRERLAAAPYTEVLCFPLLLIA